MSVTRGNSLCILFGIGVQSAKVLATISVFTEWSGPFPKWEHFSSMIGGVFLLVTKAELILSCPTEEGGRFLVGADPGQARAMSWRATVPEASPDPPPHGRNLRGASGHSDKISGANAGNMEVRRLLLQTQ